MMSTYIYGQLKKDSLQKIRKDSHMDITFKLLDRLYKSIEDLGNIYHTKDSNVRNVDVHESIEKVLEIYTDLKELPTEER